MFTKQDIERALNNAMEQYIADPAKADAEWPGIVEKFKADRAAGREPSYGKSWADYVETITKELKHGQRENRDQG